MAALCSGYRTLAHLATANKSLGASAVTIDSIFANQSRRRFVMWRNELSQLAWLAELVASIGYAAMHRGRSMKRAIELKDATGSLSMHIELTSMYSLSILLFSIHLLSTLSNLEWPLGGIKHLFRWSVDCGDGCSS